MAEEQPDLYKSAALPDGDYAIVELMGHRTLIGRYAEVERFGAKFIQIEPVFQGRLLDPVLHGGSSIYGLTPCSKLVAAERGATERYHLPGAIASTIPRELLPAPEETPFGEHVDVGEVDDHFDDFSDMSGEP